jgi:hypothetical protein
MTPDDLIGFKGNHVKLSVNNEDLDIGTATDIAKRKAKELSDDPMMLSWCCGKTGEYYPRLNVEDQTSRHGSYLRSQGAQISPLI